MGLLGECLKLLLCLAVVSTVNCQSEPPTTENPRDYLFVQNTDFVWRQANNNTRFTSEEKLFILQIHNSYRSLVQPPATDMRELIWDDDLEEYAWNHTHECTGAHSAGTMVKKVNPAYPETWITWTAMGENLYYNYGSWYSIEQALWLFWREGEDYDILNQECAPGKECGHYRVITLAQSYRVGCAVNVCNSFTVSKYPTPAVFLSCSYNGKYLIYYKPYTVGPRGADCTHEAQIYDFQYYRNGLCISPRMFFTNVGFDGNTSVVGLPSPYLTSTSAATTSTTASTVTSTASTTTSTASTKTSTASTTTSTASTTTSTSSTTTITTAATQQDNTSVSWGTSEIVVTTFSTDKSTAVTSGMTHSSATPRITYNSTAKTPTITDSTVVVTPESTETTSIAFITSTMLTTSAEFTTTANRTAAITTSPTTAMHTTGGSTLTSTKRTRTVSHSSRPRAMLPLSMAMLLVFILAIFDHIFY